MTFLVFPRRNRFAINPIGVGDYYVAPRNSKVSLGLAGLVSESTSASVSSNTPLSSTKSNTVVGVPGITVTETLFLKKPSDVTMSNVGSPCIVTYTAHGFSDGQIVQFATTGALPTGIPALTWLYIVSAATDTFEVSLTISGSPISSTGGQSGAHSPLYKV